MGKPGAGSGSARIRPRKRLLDRCHKIGGVPEAYEIASPRFQLRRKVTAGTLYSDSGTKDVADVGVGALAEWIGAGLEIGDLRQHPIRPPCKGRGQRGPRRR